MGKHEKLVERLLSWPSDFTYGELRTLLLHLGFSELKGKGSRRKFYRQKDQLVLSLHEPHPDGTLKKYMVEQIIDFYKRNLES